MLPFASRDRIERERQAIRANAVLAYEVLPVFAVLVVAIELPARVAEHAVLKPSVPEFVWLSVICRGVAERRCRAGPARTCRSRRTAGSRAAPLASCLHDVCGQIRIVRVDARLPHAEQRNAFAPVAGARRRRQALEVDIRVVAEVVASCAGIRSCACSRRPLRCPHPRRRSARSATCTGSRLLKVPTPVREPAVTCRPAGTAGDSSCGKPGSTMMPPFVKFVGVTYGRISSTRSVRIGIRDARGLIEVPRFLQRIERVDRLELVRADGADHVQLVAELVAEREARLPVLAVGARGLAALADASSRLSNSVSSRKFTTPATASVP